MQDVNARVFGEGLELLPACSYGINQLLWIYGWSGSSEC